MWVLCPIGMPRSPGTWGGISPWLLLLGQLVWMQGHWGGWALFHQLLLPKIKILLLLLGWTYFWLCLIMVFCWSLLWIVLLCCMSSWGWGVAGPVKFGVGGAGSVLGPSGHMLASRGAPCAHCTPTLWWVCNIVPHPNRTNTCSILHCVQQELCILLVNTLYSKIVNNKGENNGAVVVLPLSWCCLALWVAMELQSVCKKFLGNYAHMWKPVHVFLYLAINISVWSCNLIKVVMFNDVGRYVEGFNRMYSYWAMGCLGRNPLCPWSWTLLLRWKWCCCLSDWQWVT